MHDQLENFVNDHREEFDSLNPNPDILNRIQAKMGGTKEINEPSSAVYRLPSIVYHWVAAAVVIGLVGIGTYRLINNKTQVSSEQWVVNSKKDTPFQPFDKLRVATQRDSKLQVQANNQPESYVSKQATRNTQPETELSTTHYPLPTNRYALSTISDRLANMESASDRYAAVSEIMEMKKIDRDIIEVLVKTMNNDPNSNVRLAALESLGKYYREPYVKKQLVAAMSKQKDPVVQIALIEMLTKFRNTSIVNELKKIAEDGNTTKPVKDQAYSSLLKYSL